LSGNAIRQLTLAVALTAALGGALALGGCKVLTIEEDRALRARLGGDFDAPRYVDAIWASKVMPAIHAETRPLPVVASAIDRGLDKAGATLGRRVGDGSAWTFVFEGEGVVTKVDTTTPRGSVDVALPDRVVHIQTGPVVSETAIRDALPFVAFNDFTDQLAFAEVGRALTAKALAGVRPALNQLQPGRRIRFIGVANVRSAGDPLVVTPVSVTADGKASAS
jgi:predicted lipoprotein